MNAERPVRLMIVDDHPIVRRGLAALLGATPRLRVVAEAASIAEAVAGYAEHRPDVTVVDLRLGDESGADAIARIQQRHPTARFVVLTTYAADEDLFRAFRAGARAYVLKDMPCEQIVDSILAVDAGLRRIPDDIAQRLVERMERPGLSAREHDVLRLVVGGRTNKEIGTTLGVSAGTVKTHLSNILIKLGVGDRTAAATAAIQRGIVRM